MFTISSTGPATTVQKSSMGTFYMMDGVSRGNRPVWKKEGDDLFLYYAPDSVWSVGPDISSTSPYLYNPINPYLIYPNQTNWKFKNSKNKYELDTQLQVEGENMKGERNYKATV